MNDLEKFFYNSSERWSTKWNHYFEIYDRHFKRFRNQDVHVLEFGVYQGGSLQMWKNYFGPQCHINGVDLNPACKRFEDEQINIFVGDQENKAFLQELKREIPRIDIIIDDGGHTMKQQITTFEEMYPHIEENGVYLCEDLHTSYWPRFGGGTGKSDTFVNHSKKLIDYLNLFHVEFDSIPEKAIEFCRTTNALHFYDSVLVIEKRKREKPREVESGVYNKHFPSNNINLDRDPSLLLRFKRYLKKQLYK